MKVKLWQWEYEFDKADAEIVVPLMLLLLGLAFTPLNKSWLWSGGVAYYLLYFFLKPSVLGVRQVFKNLHQWRTFRCPYCNSRELVLQGFQGFRHSDEHYAYHMCNQCSETSVLVNDKLVKASR
jgi:hypothetical protein